MQEIPVGRAEAPADNTAIPYLWARTKVERLTDYGTREDVQDACLLYTSGKSASLLEQQRPNVFTMNVANVMPGDTVGNTNW